MCAEWQEVDEKDNTKRDRLLKLIHDIVPYLMGHNAEAEACDALMEIERLEDLDQYVDDTAFARVCLYLMRCVLLLKFSNCTFPIRF